MSQFRQGMMSAIDSSLASQPQDNHGFLQGTILKVMRDFMIRQLANLSKVPRSEVMETAREAYMKHVAPINIVWIPDHAEEALDKSMADVLAQLAGLVYDQLVKSTPIPTPGV